MPALSKATPKASPGTEPNVLSIPLRVNLKIVEARFGSLKLIAMTKRLPAPSNAKPSGPKFCWLSVANVLCTPLGVIFTIVP